jgi:tyrosyl-tRNA synthetase
MHVLDTLVARGFVQQSTGLDAIRALMDEGPVTFYVGFDPTASSLHAGHLVPIMAMGWLQRAGHRPIAIVGGGTSMVGDPSGKTEMRQLLTRDDIAANTLALRAQLSRFITFEEGRGLLVDNAECAR